MTPAACMTPRIGGSPSSSRLASRACTASRDPTSRATASTETPRISSARMAAILWRTSASLASLSQSRLGGNGVRPASTRRRAPRSASQAAISRPRAPMPPVMRYAASGRHRNGSRTGWPDDRHQGGREEFAVAQHQDGLGRRPQHRGQRRRAITDVAPISRPRDVHQAAPQLGLLGPDDPGESPQTALAHRRVGDALADAARDDPQRGRVVGHPARPAGGRDRPLPPTDGPRSRCRSQRCPRARGRLRRGHTVPRRRRPASNRRRRADRGECGAALALPENRERARAIGRLLRVGMFVPRLPLDRVRQRARVDREELAGADLTPQLHIEVRGCRCTVLPSGAFTAMSTMSSSSLPPRRCTSTEPWSSASSASKPDTFNADRKHQLRVGTVHQAGDVNGGVEQCDRRRLGQLDIGVQYPRRRAA